MLIMSVQVKRFHSIFDEILTCESLTALVGANSSGKSSFLRALDLFFSPNPRYTKDDFYNGDIMEGITIKVTFNELTVEEKAEFQADTITLCRKLFFQDGKKFDQWYKYTLRNPDFEGIRASERAQDVKVLYRELCKDATYSTLPDYSSHGAILQNLTEWEISNPSKCSIGEIKESKDILGTLNRYLQFIFVPAVHDAADDAIEGKDSAITALMDTLVRKAIIQRKDIQDFENEIQGRYQEIINDIPEVDSLATSLTSTLSSYIPNISLTLEWNKDPKIIIPPLKADVRLIEDDYSLPITGTGHGLQRTFILTIFQHLISVQSQTSGKKENITPAFPTLVLAIEEPELYQHPTRQRHFARLLKKLADGQIDGVSPQTQVLYCTHSPLFVGLDRISQIRLIRKEPSSEGNPRITKIKSTNLSEAAHKLQKVYGSAFTSSGLESRIQNLMTPGVNEAFFADVAVLVEGETDRAALLAVSELLDCELESFGVSIIACGGKQNLDKLIVLFNQCLDIPIYVVWDSDKNCSSQERQKNIDYNLRLQRLMGCNISKDWPSGVTPIFASFENNLNETLCEEIGREAFAKILSQSKIEYDINRDDDAIKRPAVLSRILRKASENGLKSTTLNEIVFKIVALKNFTAKKYTQNIQQQVVIPDVVIEDDELVTMYSSAILVDVAE